MSTAKETDYETLQRMVAAGQGGPLVLDERNRRLASGDATLAALKRSVNDLVSRAPQDHDILIMAGDLAIQKVAFIEPHTFLFEGIDHHGHHAGVVIHYTQVSVRVIYRPKQIASAPRVITGFSPNAA